MLSSGRLFQADELADLRRGHDPYLTSPLGWRPAGDDRQAPTYPPGLPLLMAIPHAIAGVTGASALVIVAAGIAIVATGLLAFQLAGSIAAVIAAAFIAFTPVFIHQSIQPMSDVPVTAAWMLCFLMLGRGGIVRSRLPGIACAIAVLIRPNLAPLAIVPLFVARNRIAFAAPVAIAGACLAAMQWLWYGSPLRSGYGSAEELFALSNIAPNASRYVAVADGNRAGVGARGLRCRSIEGQSPCARAVRVRGPRDRVLSRLRRLRRLVVLAVPASGDGDLRDLRGGRIVGVDRSLAGGSPAAPAVCDRDGRDRACAVGGAIDGHVQAGRSTPPRLRGRRLRQRRRAARSGDRRRRAERIDALLHGTPDPAMGSRDAGRAGSGDDRRSKQSRRPVYIVLDAWEDGLFRAKFPALPAGALDWPPILDAGTSHRTRLWKLSDRERFQRGESLNTIRLP